MPFGKKGAFTVHRKSSRCVLVITDLHSRSNGEIPIAVLEMMKLRLRAAENLPSFIQLVSRTRVQFKFDAKILSSKPHSLFTILKRFPGIKVIGNISEEIIKSHNC